MRKLSTVVTFLTLGAALALAGCGGKAGRSASASPSAPAAAQSMSPMTAASGASTAMAHGGSMQAAAGRAMAAATIPPGLDCGAVKPVWVNLASKVYHEPGDPYYGKTRRGKYLCPGQAKAQGYHPAGGGAMMTTHRHHARNGGG